MPLLPSATEQSFLIKPTHFNFKPKIPVLDDEDDVIDVSRFNLTDRPATVFFQVGQLCYMNTIRFQPEIAATQVNLTAAAAPKKKVIVLVDKWEVDSGLTNLLVFDRKKLELILFLYLFKKIGISEYCTVSFFRRKV